ncbi:PREDICTED: uncharacterized protein LOC104733742 [Camelina sativa]|uniref:Uncharacterized protein LOC104733742 n=1 Tax=Camelina sativa TaxID=90675 RepID=A0ABM0V6G0_CAMSA|nr:PREDICTED: uncharacterized protein LOC104733742 [Camelina sativa]
MLFVNVIPSEPQPEQVPIVPIVPTVPTVPIGDQSSVGMNYENQHAKDGEIGPNAIVVYVGKEKAVEGDSNKEGEAESRDEGDEYTEPRPVVEPLKSDKVRYVVKCPKEGCNWGLRGGRIRGQMETPPPKIIMDLVKTKLGVDISYSTALRGKNQAVTDLKGSPEESYKMLRCYLHMLEKVNHGTRSYVHCDENNKFMYLFIALGASIEGFKVMRKVITMDATFLKNGYKGVLVFASAKDPNRHHYPLAFGVLDVFMTDRNTSLIKAIANVYPLAHHGFCIWHLSQNMKGYARNVNKDVVAWRFMECSRFYTVAEFNIAYASFTTRYPSAAKYLEESTQKERWARCVFPGDRYNLDTSNCVESLNSVFKDARRYSLIPMLDAILKKFSEWFNEHRKDAVSGSVANKLVPLVENYLHDLWATAEKLKVIELNGFELEYNVIDSDGKPYLVKLRLRSCSCRFFDIQKYPCVHALASFITYQKYGGKDFELHELCSKYYWTELWAIAYCRTIYLVPDKSRWDILDDVQDKEIIPPNRKIRGGRKKTKRGKNWADAIEEETQTLRKDVDNHWERLKEFEPHHTKIYNLQMELKEKSDEIAKLKEELALLTTRVDLLDRLCFD